MSKEYFKCKVIPDRHEAYCLLKVSHNENQSESLVFYDRSEVLRAVRLLVEFLEEDKER